MQSDDVPNRLIATAKSPVGSGRMTDNLHVDEDSRVLTIRDTIRAAGD